MMVQKNVQTPMLLYTICIFLTFEPNIRIYEEKNKSLDGGKNLILSLPKNSRHNMSQLVKHL